MAQTTPRETLTCLAFSYFSSKGSGANIEDFSNVVYDYYFNDNISELNKYISHLAGSFKIKRIQEFYKESKSGILKKEDALNVDKDYPIRIHQKDFPNGTLLSSKEGLPTKLDGEIKSAFLSAEALQKSTIIGNLSQYIFYDQSTDFMKNVKDDALEKTKEALELPKDVGSDILSSIDLIAVKRNSESKILNDFENNLTGSKVTQMNILNNLAHGTKGQNTFRTLTNKYFSSKEMVGISLKKVPSNRNAVIKIIGTIAGAKGLEIYLDPYTEFLGKVSEVKNRAELFKLVDELVEIAEIMPTEPRAYFAVKFKLNYKKIDISDKIVTITLQIGRSGFNASEAGKGGFVGGASYQVGLPVLKKYPRYNQMVREVSSMREKAFKYAINKTIPNELKSSYNKALATVKKNELVLYSNEDNKIIQTFCEKYDETIKNPQNSFQQYRIGVSKLCKNKTLQSSNGPLMDLNIKNMSTTGVPKTLQNDYVHSQGLWMYTRENENLKKFFKQQISLTLYGIMSKKGAKVFYSKNRETITEDAFVKEFKLKNGLSKLAKFATAPYVMID